MRHSFSWLLLLFFVTAGLTGCSRSDSKPPKTDSSSSGSNTSSVELPPKAANVPKATTDRVSEAEAGPNTVGLSEVKQAALTQRSENLQQIAQCLLNYHNMTGSFPTACTRDEEGHPLLSWRVQCLPYLDKQSQALYELFHFEEPWDSAHNKKLIERIPEVFCAPRHRDGKTNIMLLVGPGAPFSGKGEKGPRLHNIKDGESKTILVVEAGSDKAVPWTQPVDIPFHQKNPKPYLGQIPLEGLPAVFMDESVHWLVPRIASETLSGLVTHRGGENIDAYLKAGD